MIISASRRTDIPAYFSDWFLNRIKEGFVMTRNPRNPKQVRRIDLTPSDVDGIVFWTKNPMPLIKHLAELQDYMYYFQFSITPYGKDIEVNVPEKNTEIFSAFKELSNYIGPDRIIWRYDPILINPKYTIEYHTRAFEKIAKELHSYTHKVIFSFIDVNYRGVKSNINILNLTEISTPMQEKLAATIAEIARNYGLTIYACAQELDLQKYGIQQGACVDSKLLEQLHGRSLNIKKDKNQRNNCSCASSVDIGVYNTCLNGCRYCYANYNSGIVAASHKRHDVMLPFLCSVYSHLT